MGKIANHKINYLLFIDILKIKITVMKSINFSINAKHMYLFILFFSKITKQSLSLVILSL